MTRRTVILALLVAAVLPAVAAAADNLVTTITSGPPSPVATMAQKKPFEIRAKVPSA